MHYIDLFKEKIEENANKIAIIDTDGKSSITYKQIDELSDKVADKLHKLGYKKNSFIMINMERCNKYIVAYLGIIKAGMAVVPLAPTYPQDRIDYILNDCKAKQIITEEFFKDIDKYDSYLDLAGEDEASLLIYTSGSTGKPKGVLHTCRGVFNTVNHYSEYFKDIKDLRFPSCVMMTFAVHIMEYLTIMYLKGTTYIVDEDTRKDVIKLQKFYKDKKITVGQISPQILKLFKVDGLTDLKRLITCSERVSDTYFPNIQLLNLYGCTETTGTFTMFVVDKPYSNTPVGKPVKGIEVKIVDKDGNEVAKGKEGEICAIGDLRATYFNDHELTRKKFVEQPDGRVLFYTGDLGYINENDDIVFVNRKDWMLKINGHRVEPGEIEQSLRKYEGIKQAVVKGFTNPAGQNYLCAYYLSDKEIEKELLDEHLHKDLPPYMVPSFYIKLDKMPVNQNGKIDRLALKPVDPSMFHNRYRKPNNETEEKICKAFEEVLKCGKVGINDDFYALGGNSINTIVMIEKTGFKSLTPLMVLENKTPLKIAEAIHTGDIYKDTYVEKESYDLTDSQMGVYLECVSDPSNLKYNIPITYSLDDKSKIDITKAIDSLSKVINNHKVLRCVVKDINGKPQLVDSKEKILVEHIKLKESEIEKYIHDYVKPFDYNGGLLTRACIIETENKIYIQIDIHHLIFDGTSNRILFDEFVDVYNGKELYKEDLTLFNQSIREEKITEEEKNKSFEFFRNVFEGIDLDSNIISDNVVGSKVKSSSVFNCDIYNDDNGKLKELTNTAGINNSSFFISVFAFVLSKFVNQNEVCFCTVNNGRYDPRFNNTIGMFVRTMPLLCKIDEELRSIPYIRNIQNYYNDTFKNDCFNYVDVASKLSISSDIMFVYQDDIIRDIEINGVKLRPIIHFLDAQANFTLQILKDGNKFRTEISYRSDLYSKELIESFCETYSAVVREFINNSKLKDIKLIEERQTTLLNSFNDTDVEYDDSKTVVDLFIEQVNKNPNNRCLVYEDKEYTYKEVDDITNRLAKHLISKKVKKDDIVGVLINRSEYMLISSLAILKAGCAYLPIDPTYPRDRINLMIQDSRVNVLIIDESLTNLVDEIKNYSLIYTKDINSIKDTNKKLTLPLMNNRFVILYTSGSTGKPKGVIYNHLNGLIISLWVKKALEINEQSNVSAYASYGFDANVFDSYAPIISGGCLHIISDKIRLDLIELQKYFNKNNITNAVLTTQIGRQFALLEGTKTLKHLVVAGEKLTPLNPPTNYKLHNAYGPTEGSVASTDFIIDKFYADVPIGKALDNLKAYVVDKYNRRLPLGASGELIITGPHVTQGYLHLKEKTKEVFFTNPFDIGKYERAYNTGDIVRYLSDGNIQFIGRRDMQVKIRGFRIELTEIEEVIRRFKGVKDATVAAFDLASGGKYLAAYVVSDNKLNEDEIKEFVQKEKPPYMVPSIIMQIDKIPLNQNQKVNRKALPIPEFKSENIIAPQTEKQKKIFEIVSKIVGHESFGIDTDIYEAGLSSIGTVNLNVELSKAFNVTVKTRDIQEHCTIRSLEELLSQDNEEEKIDVLKDYPLTASQFGIFFESNSNPNSINYNIPVLYKVDDKLDLNKLIESIIKVADAHPYIKTTLFANKAGDIRAKRNDDAKVQIDEVKQAQVPTLKEIVKPFELLNNNLYRFVIYKTDEGNFLFMDLHHIINDGTSETIIFKELEKAIDGVELEKEQYTGYEVSLEEEKIKNTEYYDKAKSYYSSILSNRDNSFRFINAKENDVKNSREIDIDLNIEPLAIDQFCKDNKLSKNAYFNAVISLVLSRFANKEEINYATVHNGRNDSRLQNVVMMLVNTMPIVTTINENSKVLDLINEIQTHLVNNMRNDSYSFADITSTFGFESDVLFTFEGDTFSNDTVSNKYLSVQESPESYAKYPLTILLKIVNNKYVINISYLTDSFNEWFVRSLSESIETVANEFIYREYLRDVILLSKNLSDFIEDYNDTTVKYDDRAFSKIFEDVVEKNKNHKAVITTKETKTYDELNRMANKVAHSLVTNNVKKENIIGLMLERSADVLAVQIGINKVGAAFLSLLPSYPDDRIEYCLVNSDSPYIITTKEIYESRKELFANKSYKALILEDLYQETNEDNLNIDIDKHSLAYCIYTSGSTGTPKGVLIENYNLSNFIQTSDIITKFYNIDSSFDTGLALSSFSFDMSIVETLPFLIFGKTTVIATDEEIHDPLALSKLISDNKVKIITCTPTFITNMIDIKEFADVFKNVKALLLGAESFPSGLYEKLNILSPGIKIMNGYGPTETTISCSGKVLTSGKNITIGGPSGNVKMFVIDKNNHIQPPYANGELIICGEGVGRGYMKLPEKTAKTFFNFNNIRAYHSGDIVRVNKDGEFEFFGRNDNQIKLRGFRVELDEIENVCCSFDGVKQTKVIVRNNGSEDYLAMFFTADKQIDLNELTNYLSSKLTYYMVPQAIKQLDKMPLNSSGKIDKNALPEIVITRKKTSKRQAKKSTEQLLCDEFKKALNVEEVYVDDNFFELGGTSITASKVVMSLMSEGINIKYQNIFDNPTPESLASFIDSLNKTNVSVEKVINEGGELNEFKEALKYNNLNYASSVIREELKDVLLTGATGFLGIHVLAELLQNEKGHIYCVVRKGKYISPLDRLLKLSMYYFDEDYEDLINERVTIINADITDDNLSNSLKDYKFETIINCSACVKHYAADDVLERINVHGVENLIELALERNARLIQISSTSVPGVHTKESYEKRIRMYEDQLFMIDSMDNKYLLSKYHAEQRMFTAIEKRGLRGKVIRVGNLMGRYEDGEFQFNMNSNAFLNGIRGFVTMGSCPITHTTDPISFAPIDLTAKVVVLLAGTDDRFTAFNGDSRYSFDEYQLIEACNRCGLPIKFLEDEDYYNNYRKQLGNEKINARLQGLMTNDLPGVHQVETDNKFTAYILYRLGFAWPFIDNEYLDKTITSIKTLGFFDYEE